MLSEQNCNALNMHILLLYGGRRRNSVEFSSHPVPPAESRQSLGDCIAVLGNSSLVLGCASSMHNGPMLLTFFSFMLLLNFSASFNSVKKLTELLRHYASSLYLVTSFNFHSKMSFSVVCLCVA